MPPARARTRRASGRGGERGHGHREPTERESSVAGGAALDQTVAFETPKRGPDSRCGAAASGANRFEVGGAAMPAEAEHGAKDANVVSHGLTLRST